MINIDHIDIVVSHKCNNNCKFCIDKFINTSDNEVSIDGIENFLKNLRKVTDKKLEVLLLGGEPTVLDTNKLIDIAKIIKKYNFSPIMSTNGINKDKIKVILPYYDWIQVTVHQRSMAGSPDFCKSWEECLILLRIFFIKHCSSPKYMI